MKRKLVFICLLFCCILFFGACSNLTTSDYLRIHIRANSNAEVDQDIKYTVREKIVDIITPLIIDVKSKEDVVAILNSNLQVLEKEINDLLKEKGFDYFANIEIKQELFPTRYYGDYVLPGDYYDAIIVNLGSGSGDNWWCVVYPPLCFVESENQKVVYKSKLWEIIKQFFY